MVFWHAGVISALKTEPNPTEFEKNVKNKKIFIIIFLIYLFNFFLCDFL